MPPTRDSQLAGKPGYDEQYDSKNTNKRCAKTGPCPRPPRTCHTQKISYVNTRNGRYAADLDRPSSIQANCLPHRNEHFGQYGNWINTPMRTAFVITVMLRSSARTEDS